MSIRWLSLAAAGLLLAGCATSRDVRRLQAQIDDLRSQQRLISDRLTRMDSLAADGAIESRRLVVDVKQSLSDIEVRLQQVDARLDDLDSRLGRPRDDTRSEVPGVYTPPSANTGTEPGLPSGAAADADEIYQRAFEALKQEDYAAAIEGFSAYARQAPDAPQAASAVYWIGESFYALQQFDSALAHFQIVLDQYPESDKVPAALFRAGNIYTERGDKAKAYPYYRRLKEEFPQSLEYQQLRRRLGE